MPFNLASKQNTVHFIVISKHTTDTTTTTACYIYHINDIIIINDHIVFFFYDILQWIRYEGEPYVYNRMKGKERKNIDNHAEWEACSVEPLTNQKSARKATTTKFYIFFDKIILHVRTATATATVEYNIGFCVVWHSSSLLPHPPILLFKTKYTTTTGKKSD